MQYGEVLLPPNSMEEETNESENQARKRGNIESWSDGIMEKIKELMDISDNRIGNMIMDLSNDMDKFERRCESRAMRLQYQIDEIFRILPQRKRSKMINEAAKAIVVCRIEGATSARRPSLTVAELLLVT